MYSSKIDFIKKILIGIKTEVDIDSSQKQYDINIKSEVLFMHILNDVYGWNLEDANELRDNFKAIDLIDHDRRCVIQVTSNTKPQKVYDTIQGLKEFKKDTFYESYADYKLKMFYIDVDVSFSKTILQRFGESELKEVDLLSITHILEKIKNPDICDRVYSTLTKLFDRNSYIKKSETNIEGNVTGVGNNSGTVNQTINNYFSNQNKQETDALEKKLEEAFDKDIVKFKKAIFSYYSTNGSNIEYLREADSFKELIAILKREEECLYCLLNEMGIEHEILKRYNISNCEALKERANKTKEVDRLIIKIDNSLGLTRSIINGYIEFTTKDFSPLNQKDEQDFTGDNYLNILSQYISKELKGRKLRSSIELQLILPHSLFNKNYQLLEVEFYEKEDIYERFSIIKRFAYRIENYFTDDEKIRYWKRNFDFYENSKSKIMCSDFVYSNSKIAFFNKRECKHICIISDSSLNNDIQTVLKWGIPILLYPQGNLEINSRIDWGNESINNVKNIMLAFIDNEIIEDNATHFIYDNYYDVDFLKLESKVKGTDDDYI